MQDYAEKQLQEFRQAFEGWQDEQEQEDDRFERLDMNDDDLIGMACQIAAEFYGGKK